MVYFVFSSPSFPSLCPILSLSEQSTGKLCCQDQKHTKAPTRVFSVHPGMFLILPTQKPLLYLCADTKNFSFTSRMVRVAFASICLFAQSSQIDGHLVGDSSLFLSRGSPVSFFALIFSRLKLRRTHIRRRQQHHFSTHSDTLETRVSKGFSFNFIGRVNFLVVCVCFSSVTLRN